MDDMTHHAAANPFGLSAEQESIRDMARAFAAEQLAPHALRWDETKHFPIDVIKRVAALGMGGIYIREDLWGDRPLVAHELVHVAQYERYGSVEAFLRAYLEECLMIGYPNGPLEQEAISRAAEACS